MEHAKKPPTRKMKSHLLLELILLLIVIGAIAFFAVPKLMLALNNSRQASADNDAKIISIATKTWLAEQETKELIPLTNEALELDDKSVKEILAIASSIDEKTSKTVKIVISGKAPPDCYKLEMVELVKKEFKAKALG